ncbi:MAG: sulfatase [Planctomycetota bacterium]|nr:sulfatase [Planctomycetota bacterium]
MFQPSFPPAWSLPLAIFFPVVAALHFPVVAGEQRPNFVVIFCDNLGYGDIEPFGSQIHRTPHLNRMAKEGRLLTHFCVTAGVCTPSRASLMTGCYAQRVGMHTNPRDGQVLRPLSPYGLNPDEVTLAEVLKTRGYSTAIIGKWHLGDQLEFLPCRQGFDHFFGIPYSDDMTTVTGQRLGERFDGKSWPPLPLMENETVIEAPCDRNGLTRRYTERAIQWMDKNREKPFFLYMPQAMPGSTRTPFSSPKFRGRSRNGPWGDAIEELDASLGQILDQLRKWKIDRKTFVIWTSDNGSPLSRKAGDLSRGSNRPLHGRGYTTSEGAFRVPTIVWQPGHVPAGTTCDRLATTMDLLPTFARLAGAEIPKGRTIDGHDIRELLFAKKPPPSPYKAFFYYQQDQLQAVRSGPWKYFLPVEPIGSHPHFSKGSEPEELLFHLEKNIDCKNNVTNQTPGVVARLRGLAEQGRRELGDRLTGKPVPGLGQRPRGEVSTPPTARTR